MKSLKDVLNEWAIEEGDKSWEEAGLSCDFDFEYITKRYAKEVLKEAAEIVEQKASPVNNIVHEHKLSLKESILNIELK
jgi:predicted subunit of tRNA(5-methylaminomethyl-2-thiouridylate) methyltransferase